MKIALAFIAGGVVTILFSLILIERHIQKSAFNNFHEEIVAMDFYVGLVESGKGDALVSLTLPNITGFLCNLHYIENRSYWIDHGTIDSAIGLKKIMKNREFDLIKCPKVPEA